MDGVLTTAFVVDVLAASKAALDAAGGDHPMLTSVAQAMMNANSDVGAGFAGLHALFAGLHLPPSGGASDPDDFADVVVRAAHIDLAEAIAGML